MHKVPDHESSKRYASKQNASNWKDTNGNSPHWDASIVSFKVFKDYPVTTLTNRTPTNAVFSVVGSQLEDEGFSQFTLYKLPPNANVPFVLLAYRTNFQPNYVVSYTCIQTNKKQ
jgi:hypothetical protein